MKRILITTIQTSIAVLLLWWIFRDPQKNREMMDALKAANPAWLIAGLLCVGCAFLLQTQRWRLLMRVQGIDMEWWRALRVFFIGAFFNLFLLGSTGGDIIKIYYAMRETASKKSAAFLSVLVDRMMGLIAMVAVAIVLCGLRFDLLMSNPITKTLFGTLIIILGGSLAMVALGFVVDRFNLAHKLPHWLPMHAKIVELSSAFSIYARSPKTLAATFAISLPAHILNFLAFYFTAQAFGVLPGLTGLVDILAVLPIILTIAALPITPAGVGMREGLFQQVFSALFNIPPSISVPISLIGFLMTVAWGLIGGLVYLAYRPSGGLHIKDMEKEVASVEESIENQA